MASIWRRNWLIVTCAAIFAAMPVRADVAFFFPLFFEIGKADIGPDIEVRLAGIASAINAYGRTVLIEGHSDRLEGDITLPTVRAEAVKARLVNLGVAADRMKVAAVGSSEPFGNPPDDQKNRNSRVQIWFNR